MASADSSLLKELECSICCEEYREPVVLGSCNHSFCKNCLWRYIEAKATHGMFPCPLCRAPCTVPANGINGLVKNFTLENIIEKYNDVRKGLNQIKWNKCSFCTDSNKNVSSSFACPQCDGISLCNDCGLEHAKHPRTGSHDVTSLCALHGKPLSQFCKSCGRPICVVCFGKHSKSVDHDVVDYKEVVKTGKEDIQTIANKAGEKTGQLREQVTELEKVMTAGQRAMEDRKKNAVVHFNAGEKKNDESIAYHTERAEYHRVQMELMNQKKDEDVNRKKRILELRKLFLNGLTKDQKTNTEDIAAAIKCTTTIQEEIQIGLKQSDSLISEKLLRAELHDDITKTKTKLQELTAASDIDRAVAFQERMMTDDGLSEEYVATAGRLSTASLRSNLTVPEGEFSVWSVSYMSRDRIAASVYSAKSYKLLLWNLPSLTYKVIMQDNVCIRYIAALGQGSLVVLRRASPILKVINVVTQTTRDIDVKLPQEAVDHLWSVEVVGHENFLVSYGEVNDHIVLANDKGFVLCNIESKGYMPTFCRMTGMITMCTGVTQTISCYQVNDNRLTEIMSAPHGVKGFMCRDICSGSLGEIFIAGMMVGDEHDREEIRLYQLDIDTGKKTVSMKRIEIKDIELRSIKLLGCSVHGNCLVIGYDSTVKVLKLSA